METKGLLHSTICWKGLIEVFNLKTRPWINMDGENSERIMEQVRKCPSGALTLFHNSGAEGKEQKP